MKKLLSLLLVLACLLSCSAMALNYTPHMTNEATFETMEEARVNGPAYLNEFTGNQAYIPDPCMEDYPEGTTYVYRSASMYTCLSAAPRMNTTILVYTDETFASKDEALAYITDMGLTAIVDAAYGSVVLVTPIDPEAGFGDADQYAYYQMQSAQCNIGGGNDAGTFADNNYYGGLTYRYVIGINGGATFINNYVSSNLDYVGRIAGLLLVNGTMERIRKVAGIVPVYMVNPTDVAVEKYKDANRVDSWGFEGDVETYFNQQLPLQKVCVAHMEEVNLNELVPNVYETMFVKMMRNAVVRNGLYTASTPFRSYNFNDAPYSLAERNAFYTGVTEGGINVTEHHEDRFADIADENGAYIDVWYELIPEEVLNGKAPDGTVPLILANHGGGDDPMQYLDEIGMISIAEHERVAVVAPYHSGVGNLPDALPALVQYMLDTYPALDASHTYVTGYSMGGRASLASLCGNAGLFAAAVPQGAVTFLATEEQEAQYKDIDIPMLFMTSTYDYHVDADARTLRLAYWNGLSFIYFDYETLINQYLGYNELPQVEYDFETYPYIGFKADTYSRTTVNGEYGNHNWFVLKDGVPMVGLNITEDLPHGLYQEYAHIAWNFMKHYSRNVETGEITYTPIVD